MTGYTNTFGGNEVNPAQPSLRQTTLAANTELVWARYNYNSEDVIADQLVVTCNIAGLAYTLPEANLGSTGFACLFTNIGAEDFDVDRQDGVNVCTVPAGEAVFVTLLTNSTAAGTWMGLQFAVGSSAVIAAALAGAGLQAISGLLCTAWPMTSTGSNPVSVTTAAYRSRLLNWTGGAGVANLATVTGNAQWFFGVKNSGSGTLTLTPVVGQLIDGSAGKVIGVGESFIVITDGTNWYTLGNRLQFTATRISIDISGSGTYTLAASEQGFSIYEFTGILTGGRTVEFPAVVGQYTIYDNTTGSFSLTISSTASGGSDISFVSQQMAIAWTDGTNFFKLIDTDPFDEGKVVLLAELFA